MNTGVGRRQGAEVRGEVAGEGAPVTAGAQEAVEDEGGGGDGDVGGGGSGFLVGEASQGPGGSHEWRRRGGGGGEEDGKAFDETPDHGSDHGGVELD